LRLRHARPSRSVVAGRSRVLERLLSCHECRADRGSKRRRQHPSHRLGTGCGGWGGSPNGECRPVMEGTSGAAERAHLRGWECEAALSRCACGSRARDAWRRASVAMRGEPWEARAPRLWRSHRFRMALVTAHDRRCSSRSGRGQAPPASDRGGRGRKWGRHRRASARPLTRGTSAGQLAQARPAIRSPERARKGATSGRKAAPAGDCGCGAAELGYSWSCSWIVPIAEVDRRCPASIPQA
jgi:hypothetical protein